MNEALIQQQTFVRDVPDGIKDDTKTGPVLAGANMEAKKSPSVRFET